MRIFARLRDLDFKPRDRSNIRASESSSPKALGTVFVNGVRDRSDAEADKIKDSADLNDSARGSFTWS
jgi:hypothetical protein